MQKVADVYFACHALIYIYSSSPHFLCRISILWHKYWYWGSQRKEAQLAVRLEPDQWIKLDLQYVFIEIRALTGFRAIQKLGLADACEQSCLLFCSCIVIAALEVYGTVLFDPLICFYKTLLSMVLANGCVLIWLSICHLYLIMHSGSALCVWLFMCQAAQWKQKEGLVGKHKILQLLQKRDTGWSMWTQIISITFMQSLYFSFCLPGF